MEISPPSIRRAAACFGITGNGPGRMTLAWPASQRAPERRAWLPGGRPGPVFPADTEMNRTLTASLITGRLYARFMIRGTIPRKTRNTVARTKAIPGISVKQLFRQPGLPDHGSEVSCLNIISGLATGNRYHLTFAVYISFKLVMS